MSDPYNSGPHVPPTAPLVADPSPRAQPDPIARLDVSDAWKRKFRLIEKAGGPDLPHFRDLPFGERLSLSLNVLALLFGPVYYLIKGLWRQAVLYVVIAIALGLVLDAIGFGEFLRGVGYGFSALYAFRANISYYKKAVLGETPWL